MEKKYLVELIHSEFKDLEIREYSFIDSGWDNYVVFVNKQLVFKIPRDQDRVQHLRNEIDFLSCLDGCPTKIPDFRYVKDRDDLQIGGYEYIKGEPLNSLTKMSDGIKNSLAEFLNFLYAKKNDSCLNRKLGPVDKADWVLRMSSYREEIFGRIYEYLNDAALSSIASNFQEFIGKFCETLEVSPAHCDLYRTNVLVDPKTGLLSGVLDWGDAAIGDPALDFAALAVDFSVSEIEDILSQYRGRVDANFRRRVEFYWKLEPIYGMMYYKERNNEAFQMKKKELEEKLVSSLF